MDILCDQLNSVYISDSTMGLIKTYVYYGLYLYTAVLVAIGESLT